MDSTGLSSNGAAYRSRGYQLEMLEASRKENIIVAVCPFLRITTSEDAELFYRWTQGVEKLICMFPALPFVGTFS
jgi:hypothetical protein